MDYAPGMKKTPVRESFGSMAWGRRTQGSLSGPQKLELVGNLAFVQLRELFDRVRSKLGHAAPPIELDTLMPPETSLTKDALELAVEFESTPLLFHSWRSYFMGRLIAAHDQISHDPELLFAAAILHDIALGDAPGLASPEHCCFAITGGEAAREMLQGRGHPHEVASRIGEAIALHLNMHVRRRTHGAEAHLVSRGAVCDLFGAGHHRIARQTLADLHTRYPRQDVVRALGFETLTHRAGSRADIMGRMFGHEAPSTSMYEAFEA